MNIARRSPIDIIAIVLLALSAITMLGMLGLTSGGLVDPWVRLALRWFGWGAYVIPLAGGVAAYAILRQTRVRWSQVIMIELLYFSGLGLMSALGPDSLPEAELGLGGGIIGWAIATGLGEVVGAGGRVVSLFALVGMAIYGLYRARGHPAPLSLPETSTSDRAPAMRQAPVPQQFRKQFKLKEQGTLRSSAPRKRDARLPSLDLLETGRTRQVTAKDINRTAGIIEKTLSEFGLPAKVVDFRSGPAVTQFAVEPGYVEHIGQDGTSKRNKVRVSQISALANDLALALSAAAIRIEAPVPGKAYVGVEVPNPKPELVRLRPILDAEPLRSTMHIALGRDVAGSPVIADLTAMPHLLIAGTTGSGKSVCIASLATCLALNNGPDDLRFVMIDPKRVELLRFNGLPHLMGKVETDLTRIAGILRWCTVEMDRRFRLLEEASARDLAAYNRKISRRKGHQTLPRLVVMIDELSDLMMLAPDQTEAALVRLAQMARATGIHLVVATQRPSTDVVTGLIKANFPARIAFAVASGVDSRVILDSAGAESLLGQGDMLYLAPEAAAPVRLQGVYVSDKEVEALISDWTEQRDPQIAAPWEEFLVKQEALEEQDDVLEAAIELIRQSGQASASLLQRRLRIGFPRAARLMDELEEMGIIGRPQAGGRTREVLIQADDPPSE
jgi:S-DNA-T family DNA segregation ATPase FtsK/SpoIIIE